MPTPRATATETPSATATLLAFTPIAYERNPRAVLIEADVRDAATPRDAHVPLWRLYADGLVVFAGERAPLATGLDAQVRVGHLSDTEIQALLAYLTQTGFFSLLEYYEPRPKPDDAPTAHISILLNRATTVRVYAPADESTPAIFSNAFQRITQTIPADAQPFVPTEAYLVATDAGTVSSLASKEGLIEWTIAGVNLANADAGVTISGNAYAQIAALRAGKPENALYREGARAYRVRLAPNLPRAVHLTDWVGTILNAPREFDGRTFEIVGYYRGWNLLGEARGTPATRSDWVIADDGGAIYVTGAVPRGLDPSSRADVWNVVRLTAKVVYVRLGTSYLEARRVEQVSSGLPTPAATGSPTPSLANADAAIAAVKARFPEVAKIQKATGMIGATTDIKAFERVEGWDIVFLEGWGDCMAGCINNRYYYFTVRKDGRMAKVGEYQRVYNATTNAFETTGVPMWGVPK